MPINLKDILNSKLNLPQEEIPAGSDLTKLGQQHTVTSQSSTIGIERTVRTKDGSEVSTFSINMEVKDARELREVLDAVGYEPEKEGLLQRIRRGLWNK